MLNPYADRSVLVTGAGGSIGSKLCEHIVAGGASRLTLVSLTEAGLYHVERMLRSLGGSTQLVPVLGHAGDVTLMREVLEGVDLVVHAAAHKHVPICETNPIAAIANNAIGTIDLMRTASTAGVRQFCLISTDKAVKPSSIMGATKRLAELFVMAAAGDPRTAFFTVRFGNVCDSAGSVLPLWREQIAKGGPLTLTDERCTRYFMSIADAVGLIDRVIALEPNGGTFVFDMGEPRKLIDIAREMIAQCGRDIPIIQIGLRPGEKITEELHYGGELQATAAPGVWQVVEAQPAGDPDEWLSQLQLLTRAVLMRERDLAVDALWRLVA